MTANKFSWMVLLLIAANANALPTAATTEGEVAGTVLESGVAAYLGIPYASAPTGEARWRAPRPAEKRAQTLLADHFGPGCMQPLMPPNGPWSQEFEASPPYAEDCLTLNIWTPSTKSGAKLPVLFWIHGGGLLYGSNSVPIYNGAEL